MGLGFLLSFAFWQCDRASSSLGAGIQVETEGDSGSCPSGVQLLQPGCFLPRERLDLSVFDSVGAAGRHHNQSLPESCGKVL